MMKYLFILILALLLFSACEKPVEPIKTDLRPVYNFAFIGDVGLNQNSQRVIHLLNEYLLAENQVIFLGDLGYDETENGPLAWREHLVPLVAQPIEIIGNHDVKQWTGYQDESLYEPYCKGEYGILFSCEFDQMTLVGLGIGTIKRDTYLDFLEEQLSQSQKPWKVCAWHKNRKKLQLGGKGDDVPLEAFEICRKYGAIVMMGHEHSYSRTKLITNYVNMTYDESNIIGPGHSVSIVSGLGGKSIRPEIKNGDAPYWAKKYTATQDAKPSVLFCNVQDIAFFCELRTIDGEVIDSFEYYTPRR